MGNSGVNYFIARKEGRDMAAYDPIDAERQKEVPPHGMAYVHVENVEETVHRAKPLDGTIAVEPPTVMDAGRLAVV